MVGVSPEYRAISAKNSASASIVTPYRVWLASLSNSELFLQRFWRRSAVSVGERGVGETLRHLMVVGLPGGYTVLQRVAAGCSVWHVACDDMCVGLPRWYTLQHAVIHCTTLQRPATHRKSSVSWYVRGTTNKSPRVGATHGFGVVY